MRTFWPLLILVFFVACDSPLEPTTTQTNTDDDQIVQVTNIINVGGDHTHDGDGDANTPPQIRNPGTQFFEVDQEVLLVIPVFDPDLDDELSCTLTGAPRNLVVRAESSACIVTGNVTPSSVGESPYVATLSVSDGKALDAEQFIINVAEPEVV